MPERRVIRPPWPWAERFRIAQAVVCPLPGGAASVIYVSGQVAYRPDGSIAGSDSIARAKDEGLAAELRVQARQEAMRVQARQVFANIDEVLRLAGATRNDIVKLSAFLTDWTLFAQYAEIRRAVFGEASFAATGVEVNRLVHPDLLIEIEVVAQTA